MYIGGGCVSCLKYTFVTMCNLWSQKIQKSGDHVFRKKICETDDLENEIIRFQFIKVCENISKSTVW